MVFSSLIFLYCFLPAVFMAYYAAPRPAKNFVLLVSSLIFYGWGEPAYVILMAASVLISYIGGILIDRFLQAGRGRAAKAALLLSCFAGLFLLLVFKYADFAAETVNKAFGTNLPLLSAALPIGISFYTFQTISYTVDVYRKEAKVQKSLISFGTYVAMFPQLIAGPIVRYKTIAARLCSRRETVEQFAEGIHRFVLGLGKKVLIANCVGALWNTVQSFPDCEIPVLTAWLGLAAYTFQIYFDFSAYSDMAIGLGHMFGFQFPENFNYPYCSKSITEFWRRWHISLGVWFREYVYIPLGGNREGRVRHIRNILIVWLLTGIWHGASWNFVAWGVYYGVLLLAEKYVLGQYLEKLPAGFRHVYCMFFVMVGWNLFAFDDMGRGLEFMRALFGMYGRKILDRETIYLFYNHAFLLAFCIFGSTKMPSHIGRQLAGRFADRDIIIGTAKSLFYIGIFLLSTAWLVDAAYNPFLYFRF